MPALPYLKTVDVLSGFNITSARTTQHFIRGFAFDNEKFYTLSWFSGGYFVYSWNRNFAPGSRSTPILLGNTTGTTFSELDVDGDVAYVLRRTHRGAWYESYNLKTGSETQTPGRLSRVQVTTDPGHPSRDLAGIIKYRGANKVATASRNRSGLPIITERVASTLQTMGSPIILPATDFTTGEHVQIVQAGSKFYARSAGSTVHGYDANWAAVDDDDFTLHADNSLAFYLAWDGYAVVSMDVRYTTYGSEFVPSAIKLFYYGVETPVITVDPPAPDPTNPDPGDGDSGDGDSGGVGGNIPVTPPPTPVIPNTVSTPLPVGSVRQIDAFGFDFDVFDAVALTGAGGFSSLVAGGFRVLRYLGASTPEFNLEDDGEVEYINVSAFMTLIPEFTQPAIGIGHALYLHTGATRTTAPTAGRLLVKGLSTVGRFRKQVIIAQLVASS